jgi:hypothetical protein
METGIHLICEPNTTIDWEQGRRYPPYSIFIDGYCAGRPRATVDGLILNLNHHEDVEEFATRATCMQAYYELRTGLYKRFSKEGRPYAALYVNDRDQDVAATCAELLHPEWIVRPKMVRYLRVTDLLDSSAGLFPLDADARRNVLPELCWIYQPFTESRHRGEDFTLTSDQCEEQIMDMVCRFRASLFGKGERLTPDTDYDVLEKHPLWVAVRENGQHARYGMSEDGIAAFVSVLHEEERHNKYSICRLSHATPFPMEWVFPALNKAEGIPETAKNKWGGSSTRGGSPRDGGSRLTLAEVSAVIEEVITHTKEMRQALIEQSAQLAEERSALRRTRDAKRRKRCCAKDKRR